ncbi:hypothetical protein [Thiococcus pfennigii]|uniref:hypothetical protein n=1 Tax=Thiococcus pfennigii TaxID=1057 RepID=UPI001905F4FA|nr:hypothetical protein [Thiococcus pfennigii]MBK1699739.1 hypothetical protein [Thiococcus pfennigii]
MDDASLIERIARLETLQRGTDNATMSLWQTVATLREEHAKTRQEMRILDRALSDLAGLVAETRADVKDAREDIQDVGRKISDHSIAEARDRRRLWVATLSAAGPGAITLAVLLWSVWQVIERLP